MSDEKKLTEKQMLAKIKQLETANVTLKGDNAGLKKTVGEKDTALDEMTDALETAGLEKEVEAVVVTHAKKKYACQFHATVLGGVTITAEELKSNSKAVAKLVAMKAGMLVEIKK